MHLIGIGHDDERIRVYPQHLMLKQRILLARDDDHDDLARFLRIAAFRLQQRGAAVKLIMDIRQQLLMTLRDDHAVLGTHCAQRQRPVDGHAADEDRDDAHERGLQAISRHAQADGQRVRDEHQSEPLPFFFLFFCFSFLFR